MKKTIEKLLDGSITAYQIAKAIGVQPVIIQRYINGERSIGNMTLDRAIELYEYAKSLEENKMTQEQLLELIKQEIESMDEEIRNQT